MKKPKIIIIVAMTEQGVIGDQNTLPWKLSADLKRFKALTMGHPILMGRKTFESIGRPLPGRQNIVLTTSERWSAEGVSIAHDWEQAMELVQAFKAEKCFVIGGAEIYRLAFPWADEVEVTEIRAEISGDTSFPVPNWRDYFELVSQEDQVGDDFNYSFIQAKRIHASSTGSL